MEGLGGWRTCIPHLAPASVPPTCPIKALRGTEDQSSKFRLGTQTPLTKQVKSLGVSQVELPHGGCVGDAVTETKKETAP